MSPNKIVDTFSDMVLRMRESPLFSPNLGVTMKKNLCIALFALNLLYVIGCNVDYCSQKEKIKSDLA